MTSGGQGLRRFVAAPGPASPGQLKTSPQPTAPALAVPASAPAPGLDPGLGPADQEKCELCATEIPAGHSHVADLEHSSLMCACRACYLLFTQPEAGRGRWRAVPDRYLADPAHPISVAEWESLEIPVALAFFLRDSRDGAVTAFYPSPAGATQCELDLTAWEQVGADHPLLSALAPDVEAVLINRPPEHETNGTDHAFVESFIVPIDACYELTGRMRLLWRGFDGGGEARESLTQFLDTVRRRARRLDREA